MDFNKICVIGLGYIGLPTASTLAHSGLTVLGVDTNPAIITSLAHGELHIFEPGLREMVLDAARATRRKIFFVPSLPQ